MAKRTSDTRGLASQEAATRTGSGDRFLTLEEIAAFFTSIDLDGLLDGTARETRIEISARLAMAALLYTGQRAAALLDARWEVVDLEGATWTIPVADRGIGKKVPAEARPLIVPLSPTTVSIFRQLRSVADDSPWVVILPSAHEDGPPARVDDEVVARAFELLQESGRLRLTRAATIHDLRHTWRTWAGELGVRLDLFEERLDQARAVREARIDAAASIYEESVRLELRGEAMERAGSVFDRVLHRRAA